MYKEVLCEGLVFSSWVTIWADSHVAFPIFLCYHVVKALTQTSKPTLKATYHSEEQAEGLTMNKENDRVNHINNNDLVW